VAKTPTQLGPLERANLSHLKAETNRVFETSCFLFSRIRTVEKVQNPVILCVIHRSSTVVLEKDGENKLDGPRK
jgi:hypothetical protein